MRIVIDARYITDHFPGIGRYVYNLLAALGALDTSHQFVALFHPDLPNTRYDMAALARLPCLRLAPTRLRPFDPREQLAIPRLLRSTQASLYHAPYYLRSYAPLPCPSLTTLYDAIPRLFPREASLRARLLFNLLTRLALASSQHILAISASARNDLVAAYRLDPARISVTPLAADPRFRPQPTAAVAAMRARHRLPARYLLTLSSNKPHKNLVGLIEAYALLRGGGPGPWPDLVIAGQWDARYPEALRAVDRLGLAESVRFLPNVAQADLPALLSGAAAFVFPSRYEGFGLPPLEALACGAPVLCSNASSLPEVVGDAALLAEPTPAGLAAGLARMLGDTALLARLRAAGPQQATRFSWQRTAEATLAAYERLE